MPSDAARSAALRNLLAWLLPLVNGIASLVFFVAVALRATWLTRPVLTASLSGVTVAGLLLLLAVVLSVGTYSYVAERADRLARR